jgi:hypothetical protein
MRLILVVLVLSLAVCSHRAHAFAPDVADDFDDESSYADDDDSCAPDDTSACSWRTEHDDEGNSWFVCDLADDVTLPPSEGCSP